MLSYACSTSLSLGIIGIVQALKIKIDNITLNASCSYHITEESIISLLVISKNGTRLVNIKNQDAVTKIIDMAPDLISRFTGKKEEDGYTAEKVEHIINQEADKE